MPLGQSVVIVGGGHNALVTAFYLAKGGFKPVVLEQRDAVGGCAVTEEFHPGFRCSTLAHAWGPLRADVEHDMRIQKFECEILHPDPRVFAPGLDGRAVLFYNDHSKTAGGMARLSARDAERYVGFAQALWEVSEVLAEVAAMTPPSIERPSPEDLWNLLKAGRAFRGLGRKRMFDVLRWAPMAVADFVGEFFESELVRATIAARGVFGTAMGPWSAGSTAALLLRAVADPHPVGTASFPRGGLGALTRAMAESARRAGAEIRTGTEVVHIRVKEGAVSGVVLRDGEEIDTAAVVSGLDPQRTLLGLVDPLHLDPNFLAKVQHYRANGTTAKVNLALEDLPMFPSLAETVGPDGFRQALSGRIHIGPEMDYLERAFDASKYGELPEKPYLDVMIPSLLDPQLAPEGRHVMSVCAHFAPYKLRSGDWAAERRTLAERVIATLGEYAPDLPRLVLGVQVITPQDLEEMFGLTRGHIFHGELALDQLFTMRPLLDWARYLTPIRGLYLCGNGTHPGNGLTGASGANAAREIIRDLR